jgi:cysteine-rich repeat protein
MVDTSTAGAAASSDGGETTAAAASIDAGEAGQDASGEPDTSMGSTTEETTGGGAVCGNGVVEAFAVPPEECDDGNQIADDGCDDTCAADRVMFVSSSLYQAGDFKSLHLADPLCAQAANDAGLANWLKFRAWLSDSTTHARDRFKFSRGRIVLVNGLVVADSWIDLLAGKLQNPIGVTEKSETYHGGVWTGTDPQGVGVVGATHCEDWTSFSAYKTAYYGYSDRATPEWTLSALDDNPIPCAFDFAVYCLEER